MTVQARPEPASPGHAVLRAVGPLRLLTWPGLDAAGVDAAVTARPGGVSAGCYATLNLSLAVGDDPARVAENRRRLAAGFGADPGDFVFARQVHGAGVRVVGEPDRGRGAFSLDDAIPDTDALVTACPGLVLTILAADCVPLVLHDPVAGLLACVHAGWRGTAAGVAAATVAVLRDLGSRPADIHAAIGPAIPAARYQVGPEVHAALTQPRPAPSPPSPAPALESPAAADIVRPDPAAPGRWLLDLPAANRLALGEAGVPDAQIHASHLPTGPIDPSENMNAENPAVLADRGYFFSDRAARPCGRHALIARLPGTARPR